MVAPVPPFAIAKVPVTLLKFLSALLFNAVVTPRLDKALAAVVAPVPPLDIANVPVTLLKFLSALLFNAVSIKSALPLKSSTSKKSS